MRKGHSYASTALLCLTLALAAWLAGPQQAKAAITDGLVGYWPCNNDLLDYSGANNDGTGSGGGPAFVAGKIGTGAADFDGRDDLEILNVDGVLDNAAIPAVLMPTSAVSVSAWVKADTLGYYEGIFYNCFWTGSSISGYMLYTSTDNNWHWYVKATPDSSTGAAHVTATAAKRAWVHLAGTFDSATGVANLYVNGAASGNPATGYTDPIDWNPTPYNCLIGGYNDDNEAYYLDAKVDEVAVWDRALTPSEVSWLYNGGTGNPIPIVRAHHPTPADGAHDVPLGQILSWTAPADVSSPTYNVYFGTNTNPPLVSSAQTATTYDPTLLANNDYYWAVDVKDGATIYEGFLWSFDTKPAPTPPLKKGPYLLYPGVNTQMTVLWQLTATQTCTLEWGLDTNYSTGSTQTTEYGTDHQHKHTITNLTSGSKYYYRVTAGTNQYTGSFTTAPASSATAVKFLVFGDTRTQPSILNSVAAQMVATYQSDAAYQTILLHTGDWVGGDTEDYWTAEFFPTNQADLRTMEATLDIQGARGNHEGTGTIYAKYWPYPYVNAFYWSFDYGPAHVAVVDQYVAYNPGSAQYTWLQSDLAGNTKPWKFIILHQPGYSAGYHEDDINVQNDIQPLCEQYGVQVVFAGHNHYYARCAKNGIKHITAGTAGAPQYDPNPNYSQYVEFCAKEYHFCKVAIADNQLNCWALKPDGTVIDSFMLTRIPPPPTYYPGSYAVVQGSYVSGSVSSLTADDNDYLVIQSTTSGIRYATTDFTVTGITGGTPSKIDVKVITKSSQNTTSQSVYLWNYSTSAWDQKDSTTIGTSEVTRTFSVTSGTANYISGGQLKLRTAGSKSNKTFNLSHELISVTVTP
jgi:predicted phosphodiesterase